MRIGSFPHHITVHFSLISASTEGTNSGMIMSTSLPVISPLGDSMPDSGDEDNSSYIVTGTDEVVLRFDEPDGQGLQRKNTVSCGSGERIRGEEGVEGVRGGVDGGGGGGDGGKWGGWEG